MSSVVANKTKILLTTENYVTWLIPMEAKLHKIRALDIVTGKTPPPPDELVEDKTNYTNLNEDAYAEIVDCLDPEVINFVSATMSTTDRFNGFVLWQLLRNKYAGTDLTARSVALDVFLNVKFASVSKFITDMRTANQKLSLAGIHLDEQVKTLLMLKKLPATFYSFRDIISMGFAAESFDKILKKLESYAIQNDLIMSAAVAPQSVDPPATMYTTNSSSDKSTSAVACPHCKKTGHRPSNCWVKHPEKAPKTHSAHLTVVDEYNQLQSVTNWCTLPDGTRMNADDIAYDNLRYTM